MDFGDGTGNKKDQPTRINHSGAQGGINTVLLPQPKPAHDELCIVAIGHPEEQAEVLGTERRKLYTHYLHVVA